MSHIMGYGSIKRVSSQVPGTKALQRAMAILQAFTDAHPAWTLSALSAELDLRKSTAHRILSALEKEGFLSRGLGSAEYRLGPELMILGARALKAVDVLEVARPHLQTLAKSTEADVTLECLAGWEVLILAEARGQSLLGLESSVGTVWPAHATSTGKVLMAHAPEPFEEPSEGLVAITDHTIVSSEEWQATLAEVRRAGFATSIEELEYGYAAVAAPVKNRIGRVTAAVCVGAPLHRIGKERIPELVQAVRSTAVAVSEGLGHRSRNEES